MRTEFVITLEQDARSGAEAAAEARAVAREARQAAQEQAQRIREEVQARIRTEIQGPNPNPEVYVQSTPPWMHPNDIPPHVVEVISMFLFAAVIIIVGFPIARAIGRWMDRRGSPAAPVSAELAAQINRIEQAVDTMAVEIERISEAQRFQAKLLSDREKVRV